MEEKKKKVLWICHFSNEKLREHLKIGIYPLDILRKLIGKTPIKGSDFAVWNTNAVKEFEGFDDIELYIIMPHYGLSKRKQEFTINGIHYYCFRSEDDTILWHIIHHKDKNPHYLNNRKYIKETIKRVKPDIIHVIGAENPYYGLSILDIPQTIPVIVSLQTLVSDPDFLKNYPIAPDLYEKIKTSEQEIIKRADFIGTTISRYRNIIVNNIKEDAIFLDLDLAVGIDVQSKHCQKIFDFIYFSANINKAADVAIEAFALACKLHPDLTLDISGGYDDDYKQALDIRIKELGIENNVSFSGPKKTHSDVINHIKKAKYALLPLKIDLVSGTVREAMACGLPVVTTITPATPELNNKRNSVLLAPKNDYAALSEKLISLVENSSLAEELTKNAFITIEEMYSNSSFMMIWKESYLKIIGRKVF